MVAIKYKEPPPQPDRSVRANGERVKFDFEGSLALARRLWALADEIEGSKLARTNDAAMATRAWRGKFADDFALRMADEDTSRAAVVNGLRDEARGWATSWKNAIDEQSRRNRAKQVDAVRSQRSWAEEHVGDFFLGDDSDAQVAAAPVAAVPQPPLFAATQHEVTY